MPNGAVGWSQNGAARAFAHSANGRGDRPGCAAARAAPDSRCSHRPPCATQRAPRRSLRIASGLTPRGRHDSMWGRAPSPKDVADEPPAPAAIASATAAAAAAPAPDASDTTQDACLQHARLANPASTAEAGFVKAGE